jgi:uncharacterized SAM-binding protein YcdF (DUF218 family)
VVVLSGDPGERVRYAAQIFKDGYADYLVVTETGERPEREADKKAGDQRGDQAQRAGVDASAILVAGGAAGSTVEEADAVRDLARLHGFKRIIVVTDPFHTLRTRLIFKRELRGLGVAVAVRPVPGHWYRSTNWFLSRAGWRETLGEYAKIAGYLSGLLR